MLEDVEGDSLVLHLGVANLTAKEGRERKGVTLSLEVDISRMKSF